MKKDSLLDIMRRIDYELQRVNLGERMIQIEKRMQRLEDGNEQRSFRKELEAVKSFLRVEYVEEIKIKKK